ncbi:hypothetical protein M422DRAFT_270492 [Sphaerobolus stellatus SS14]|uniref:MULE transposase domain-containing protein n=1 Tax=Sphaerobolus stellatus (strain SS14) TaxID=990650 RepID=A0A0C9UH06_SPHS4|nr:hypothetical protein M422DRAFT_270492 [Sphaerobolus stellatus SS14]
MDIYNAVRRKANIDTRLAPQLNDINKWLEKLCEAGWSTLYEPTPGEEIRDRFILTLCSSWQKQLIAEYGDTVCLDSTHNTCCGNNDEKIFLSTILARDHVTGHGVRLAFMLTNQESHYPLEHFLKWLRRACQFTPNMIMIDFSNTEALAIRKSFPNLIIHISYCYWHL